MGKRATAQVNVGTAQADFVPSDLPKEWGAVRFDNAILKGRPKVGKVKSSEYLPLGRYPVIDQGQRFIAGYCDDEKGVYRGTLPVIVFGDHTRIFKFVEFPFVAGADGTQILLPNNQEFDPRFLYYALTSLNIPSRGYNRHFSLLTQKLLPKPPIPEQRAIAHILSTVQRAKEATENVIAATRQLKASLMKHLFTYGPVPLDRADQVPLKVAEIGDLPQHWRVIELGNVAEIKTSTSSPTSIPKSSPKSPTTRVLFLKVSDMNHPQNQRCVVTAAIWFDVDSEHENILNLIPKDAVVLPKRGAAIATNKKRLTTCGCLLDPNLVGVIPGEALIGDYLFAWFERFDLRTITDTTTLPQINKKDLEPLLVPVPPLHEQHQIAAQLAAVDAKLAAEESRREALDALFKSLLHHLMTGKVRLPEFAGGRS